MTVEHDPGLWQQLAGWLWIALGAPIALVWKKATNAISREELREHLEEDRRVHAEFRDTMRTLFENAENDRRALNSAVITLKDKIHELHVDMLERKP